MDCQCPEPRHRPVSAVYKPVFVDLLNQLLETLLQPDKRSQQWHLDGLEESGANVHDLTPTRSGGLQPSDHILCYRAISTAISLGSPKVATLARLSPSSSQGSPAPGCRPGIPFKK